VEASTHFGGYRVNRAQPSMRVVIVWSQESFCEGREYSDWGERLVRFRRVGILVARNHSVRLAAASTQRQTGYFPPPKHFSAGLSAGLNTPTKASPETLRSHFYGARGSFPRDTGYDNWRDYPRSGILRSPGFDITRRSARNRRPNLRLHCCNI
jgi:hypothetical protein